jgi:hypothetical protein
MTAEHITGKKDDVYYEYEAANSDPEAVWKKERPHRVVDQESPDDVG